MCIPHLKSRCTEIDSEIFLIYLCYSVCPLLNNQFLCEGTCTQCTCTCIYRERSKGGR